MTTKTKSEERIVNNNNNTTNVNVNVELPKKKAYKASTKKKTDPSWLKKLIVGGIVAFILSIAGYYIKGSLDSNKGAHPTISQPTQAPIEGKKLTN
jgi:hypothetical protein